MTEPEAKTHSLDQHRDPTEAAVVRALAADVVAQYGGDLSRMRRALGISNSTWVGGGLAVRIANTPVVDSMAAEVALVRALPPEVGHPKILGVGTIDGHDWIVTEEVRGQNLHEAWPTLTPEERLARSEVPHLMRAQGSLRMPPDMPLPETDILLFESWILAGANDD
jgi:scyllo-inosamine 4-kinase